MSNDHSGASARDADPTAPVTLCDPFTHVLRVSGAAMSTIGNVVAPETVCASDDAAAHLDELQFDLGEGPCWDAVTTQAPVIEYDVRNEPRGSWPAFIDAIQSTPVRAMFAFPLTLGPMHLGVVDLYRRAPGELDRSEYERAIELAEAASRLLLRRILSRLAEPAEEGAGEYSRRRFHQATGAVIAQLNVTAEDAALIIRAHAYAKGKSVSTVAEEILDFRLDLSNDGTGS